MGKRGKRGGTYIIRTRTWVHSTAWCSTRDRTTTRGNRTKGKTRVEGNENHLITRLGDTRCHKTEPTPSKVCHDVCCVGVSTVQQFARLGERRNAITSLLVRVGSGATSRDLHAPTHGVSGTAAVLAPKGVDEQAITIYCTPALDGKALQERLGEICIRTKRERENCWRQSLPNSDRIHLPQGARLAYCYIYRPACAAPTPFTSPYAIPDRRTIKNILVRCA